MRLVLFDIDGTLLLAGGVGKRAFQKAFMKHYDRVADLSGIRFEGKTDPQIIREVLGDMGIDRRSKNQLSQSLYPSYISFLREEISTSDNFQMLPGVRQLLVRISRDSRFLLGLATGNMKEGARLKLERVGLNEFFPFGGFGSDSESRTEIIRKAIEKGRKRLPSNDFESVIVIGDTPQDIIHGRRAEAQTLAVATGAFSLQELRAYHPDLAVLGLEPVEPVFAFLSGNPPAPQP
ncbi:MAG: HAD family hydrolase [Acidobacteriota bacterium]